MSAPQTKLQLNIAEVGRTTQQRRHLSGANSNNLLVRLARSHGRDFIKPEDISESLLCFAMDDNAAMVIHEDETVKDFLEILSRQVDGIGIEDVGLCAFVLWKEVYAI